MLEYNPQAEGVRLKALRAPRVGKPSVLNRLQPTPGQLEVSDEIGSGFMLPGSKRQDIVEGFVGFIGFIDDFEFILSSY